MKKNPSGLLIALSAGGKNHELAQYGIGEEHVEELMVRMAMRLLAAGHRLSFGGTLGVAGQPLTEYLIEACQKWLDKDTAVQVDVTQPVTWPLVNYSAWPIYPKIPEEQRATLVGICQFVDVDPPSASAEQLRTEADPGVIKRLGADALTAMRRLSATEADLRIVWGGRVQGAAGWMAGILEEVAFSIELGKPLLILGGFGGCSRLLADFLSSPDAAWPAELTLEASSDPERDACLSDEERATLVERFREVQELLASYRKLIHASDRSLGVSSEVIRKSLLDSSPRSAINTAAEVAKELV